MTNPTTNQTIPDILESFKTKVEGRLHAWIKEEHNGRPAVSCLWNERPDLTLKEVVYVGAEGFDSLALVRALNKSMKASPLVVSMLIEKFTAQNKVEVGVGVDF
jgi:hypothetical protein